MNTNKYERKTSAEAGAPVHGPPRRAARGGEHLEDVLYKEAAAISALLKERRH